MNTIDSKIRLLAVLFILNDRYPEWISTEDLRQELIEEYAITSGRRTIYSDINTIDMFVPIDRNHRKGFVLKYKLKPCELEAMPIDEP